MPNNFIMVLIIVGVVALLFGVAAGYIWSLVEGRLNSSLDEARGAPKPEEPNAVAPAPVVTEHLILKVTIDEALKLKLILDDVLVDSEEMTPEQRARLVNVIVQIRPWIDGKTVAGAAPIVPLPTPDPLPDTPMFSTPVAAQPVSTAQPPRIDPRRGFLSLLESEAKKPEPLLKNNIISLIDEVLQKKLETSTLSNKNIRIEAGATGEVIVYVGSARYISIDSVPERAIRDIIQEAITEWNNK